MKQTRYRLAIAVAMCLAIAGCKDRNREGNASGAAATAAATSLVGTWMTAEPVTFSGEGLRTETTDGRTIYRSGGTFDYTGNLRISGEKLPTAGLSFAITGTGDWKQAGGTLTERFTEVTLAPEAANAPIDRLAKTLAGEMAARPASTADIVELTPDTLTLRDKVSGETASFTREVQEVK